MFFLKVKIFIPALNTIFAIFLPGEHKSTNSSIFTNSLIKLVRSGFIYQYYLLSAPRKEFSSSVFFLSPISMPLTHIPIAILYFIQTA